MNFTDLATRYNLKTVVCHIASDKKAALYFAESLGYPVALKIESPDILHKSDIGAVKLNIKDAGQLSVAYDEIVSAVIKNAPEARIDGLSVQEMLPEGFEVIIGYINDPIFGPCIMLGMGGIFTEAVKDVSFRALPISLNDAEAMVNELYFSNLFLKGFRHIKKVPIKTISEVLLKSSKIAMDNLETIDSFDINPAIFYGDKYRIVDFKFIKKETSKEILEDKPNIESIDKFFNASSVAIVGASPSENKLSHTIQKNLMTNGYKGKIYPINPKRKEILGIDAFSDIRSIPRALDLVIVLVSLEDVKDILEQCKEKGVKSVIVISAGGKESGNAHLEEEIKQKALEYGIRIIGCNCLGVYDSRTNIDSLFFPYNKMKRPKPGNICLLSQSGTVGLCAIDILPELSKFVSYGNRIDVDEADLIKYFSKCKYTKVITLYIEGLFKGRKFYEVVKQVTPDIPIVIYKAGRSELSAKAAISHTGFLSGTHKMIEGILHQANAFQVDSFEAMLSATKSLSRFERINSNNTLLVTNGAGVTIQSIDRIESKKILKLTELSDSTKSKLSARLPGFMNIANPVDLTAAGTEEDFEAVLTAACEDKNVDIIMLYIVLQLERITENMMKIIARYAKIKPLIFCSTGADHTINMKKLLEEEGIPAFSSVDEWVSAAEALIYRDFLH